MGLFAPCLQDLEARPVECRIDAQHLFMLPAGWDVTEMYILRNHTIKQNCVLLIGCFLLKSWRSVSRDWPEYQWHINGPIFSPPRLLGFQYLLKEYLKYLKGISPRKANMAPK